MPANVDPMWIIVPLLSTLATGLVILAFVAISRYAQHRDLTALLDGTDSADRAAVIEAYGCLHPTEGVPALGPLRRPQRSVTRGRCGRRGAPSSSGSRPTRRGT